VIFKLDLHVHSKYSTDNDAEPEESILRAIERGLDGMAFTEHYSYEASEPIEQLKEKYADAITIFRGVEYSSAEGHCLVFGADTDAMDLDSASVADLVARVTEAGGVVIPSHPYRPGTSLGSLVLKVRGIAGLEGCNGANMHAYNAKAIKAAAQLRLPYTGGSDAHAPLEVGSCYTEFSERVTDQNFIELLKAGNYRGVDTRKISRSLFGLGSW
jgi:predicted metal-dependent phosphoesterase TrpH